MDFLANFFTTVKALVLQPRTFFNEIEWDCGWKDPILFFTVCSAVYALGTALCINSVTNSKLEYIRSMTAGTIDLPGTNFSFLPVFGITFILALLCSQIFSFATAVCLHLLGGSGTLQRTYLALACCWVVMLVDWIPLIGWIPGLYFFYLAYLGLARAHEVPGWKAIIGITLGSVSVVLSTMALCALVGLAIFKPPIDPRDNLPKDPEIRRLMEDYERKD